MTDATSDIQAAATQRAQEAFDDLSKLDLGELSRLSLSLRDAETRTPARDVAVHAAERAGLGRLLAEARLAARDYVTSAFDTTPFRAIGVDLAESRSRASVDDRVAVMVAAEDAVIAAVADPFISDDVRDALATPFEHLRPAWDLGDAVPVELGQRHVTVTRWSTYAVFALFVIGSLVLAVLGSGVGLFGLAAAIAIVLVALVMRGRPTP